MGTSIGMERIVWKPEQVTPGSLAMKAAFHTGSGGAMQATHVRLQEHPARFLPHPTRKKGWLKSTH